MPTGSDPIIVADHLRKLADAYFEICRADLIAEADQLERDAV